MLALRDTALTLGSVVHGHCRSGVSRDEVRLGWMLWSAQAVPQRLVRRAEAGDLTCGACSKTTPWIVLSVAAPQLCWPRRIVGWTLATRRAAPLFVLEVAVDGGS